ncbi:Uncharacterised protein [Legionella hackeliae]|nr:Uncharacterised protein [Legionella hackeliae]
MCEGRGELKKYTKSAVIRPHVITRVEVYNTKYLAHIAR